MFTPDSDWQPPSQDEQPSSSGRSRGRGDSWRGDAEAGSSSSSSGSAEAAFQPGQEVRREEEWLGRGRCIAHTCGSLASLSFVDLKPAGW